MRRKVYVETTIPSFYAETRQEPAAIYRRETTPESLFLEEANDG